jgi:hypothetical protein
MLTEEGLYCSLIGPLILYTSFENRLRTEETAFGNVVAFRKLSDILVC